MASTILDARLGSESTEAFSFSIYRDLGLKRNLDEVSQRLESEKRGSGLRRVRPNEVRMKHRKSGKIGLWSRKYQWVGRVAARDRIRQRLREKQLDQIERMAKRQVQEARSYGKSLWLRCGVCHWAQRSEPGPNGRERGNITLLKMSFESAKAIPRVHKTRTASPPGIEVVRTDSPLKGS